MSEPQSQVDTESTEAAKERRPSYGRAVDPETRRVRFLSVSAIDRANTAIGTGCLRRWFYHYILSVREGETKATARGNERHLQMANYYRTGEMALPKQILANSHMMPPPGPGLMVELSIVPTWEPMVLADGTPAERDVEAELAAAPLRCAGVPMTGAIDLINDRCVNVGGSDVEDTVDPPGTIELLDWKFPGDLKNAKGPRALCSTTQMAGYAEWLWSVAPETPHVRLSHVYMPVRGSGMKSTIRIQRGETSAAWEHAESVARSIVHAAQEQDVHKIPANTKACEAYGRQCPALDKNLPEHLRCSAGSHNSLQNMFGVTGAAALIPPTDLLRTRETNTMSLQLPPNLNAGQSVIALIKQRQASQLAAQSPQQATAAPPVIQPQAITQQVAAGVTVSPAAVATIDPAEIARLQAEEAAAKARAAVPPGFADAWATIQRVTAKMTAADGSLGVGIPALGGDAARLFAAMTDTVLNGAGFAGTGEFGQTMYSTADQVMAAAAELAQIEAQMSAPQPQLAPLQAPETPASNPAPVSQPVQTGVAPGAEPLAAIVAQANKKAGKNSKKKDPAGEAANAAAKETAPEVTGSPASGAAQAATTDGPIFFYENCTPSMPYQRLEPLVWELQARLASEAGGDDVRTTNPEGPLGYGRWKGALRSFILVTPIPPGHYVLDVSGEVMAEAAQAFRELAHRTGGGFVRSSR